MARSVLKHRHWVLLAFGIALGIIAGIATELLVELGVGRWNAQHKIYQVPNYKHTMERNRQRN